jgi:peptide/nickel transport system substrate-binding protein
MVTPPGWDMHRRPSYGPVFAGGVFNNLLAYDLTKKEIGTGTLVPELAEKWTVSPEGTAITFNLRKDVKWHNGDAFNADDVMYSVTKMMDSTRSLLNTDFPAYDSVVRLDDYTVRIGLKFPSPSFLVQLGSPYAVIQSPKTANVDFRTNAFLMGTGPFMLKSYTTGSTMELVKNPNYFKKDAAGKQLPYLDGITVSIFSDRSAVLNAMAAGQLDGHASFALNNQDEFDKVMGINKTFGAQPYNVPGIALVWLNPKFKPFSDIRVRQALRLLIDKDQLTLAGYGDARWNDPNRTVLTGAYSLDPAEMKKLIGYDLPFDQRIAKAQALMKDAGYADGFKMRYVGRQLGEFTRQASLLSDLFKKHLKIEVEILAREINDARKMRDAGDYEFYLDNPLVLVGDPDEYASWFKTTGANNFSKVGNADQDKLWDAQSREMDFAKRQEICRNIERNIINDAWIYNLQNNTYCAGFQSYVKGFTPHVLVYDNKYRMETVWIDK